MAERLHDFGAAILNPELPVPAGIVGPDGQPSAGRFAIYRNNVIVSLVDAIVAAYPVVQRLVGEQFMRAMSRIFASARPPVSPIMLEYGQEFADFIAAFPPARSVPYLADIARLERACTEAYHAREARPAKRADLAQIPPGEFGNIRLRLHPSLRLVSSPYPIVSIWRMNIDGGTPTPLDLTVGQNAMVLRPRAEVEVRELAGDSAAFVLALRAGGTPSDALKDALVINPRFDLSGHLADLLNLGLVTGWQLGEGPECSPQGELHVLTGG